MQWLDNWLQPLRAYPREWVMACVALALAGALWVVAQVAKWSVYALALGIFIVVTGVVALWLWQ